MKVVLAVSIVFITGLLGSCSSKREEVHRVNSIAKPEPSAQTKVSDSLQKQLLSNVERESFQEHHSRWDVKTLTDDVTWLTKNGLYPQKHSTIKDILHREPFDNPNAKSAREDDEKVLVTVGGYLKVSHENEPDGDMHLILRDTRNHAHNRLTLEIPNPGDPQAKRSIHAADFAAVRRWVQDNNILGDSDEHVIVTGLIFFDPMHPHDPVQDINKPYHWKKKMRVELHPILGIRKAGARE